MPAWSLRTAACCVILDCSRHVFEIAAETIRKPYTRLQHMHVRSSTTHKPQLLKDHHSASYVPALILIAVLPKLIKIGAARQTGRTARQNEIIVTKRQTLKPNLNWLYKAWKLQWISLLINQPLPWHVVLLELFGLRSTGASALQLAQRDNGTSDGKHHACAGMCWHAGTSAAAVPVLCNRHCCR